MQLDATSRLLAVPALDGVGDHRRQLRAVAVDGEHRPVGGQAIQSLAQLGLLDQPERKPRELDLGSDT